MLLKAWPGTECEKTSAEEIRHLVTQRNGECATAVTISQIKNDGVL